MIETVLPAVPVLLHHVPATYYRKYELPFNGFGEGARCPYLRTLRALRRHFTGGVVHPNFLLLATGVERSGMGRMRLLPCVLSAAGALVFGLSPAGAVPSEPFTGASARFDEPPRQDRSNNLGDWGVAVQRGSATYTLPLVVPPGRLGMEPRLALRYSSSSPLRGGIGAGWALDLPSVSVDRSLGRDATPTFRTSLPSANGRLVEVSEQSPFGGKAYRIEFDGSFARFFNPPDGALSTWIALTPDGVRHDFGNEPNSRNQQAGDYDAATRWLITRERDSHGNIVHYVWLKQIIGPYVGFNLQRIEYTSNDAAEIAPHAKVEFHYAPPDMCVGSSLPVGAAAAGGSVGLPVQIDGGQRLIGITTSVRARPGAAWRLARVVSLEYQLRTSSLHFPVLAPEHPPSGLLCAQTPIRYLTAVRITAYNPRHVATVLPPITFKYNSRLQGGPRSIIAPFETKTVASPGAAHYGDIKAALGMLVDIDSDGIPDHVSVIEERRVCTLVWRRGLKGGTFESEVRKSSLPTAPWSDEPDVAAPDGIYRPRLADERCTISGQVTYRYRPVLVTEPKKELVYVATRGVLSYHFIDFTGDGRVDLLTNVWAGVQHDTYLPRDSPFARMSAAVSAALFRRAQPGQGAADLPSIPPVSMTPETTTGYVWRVYRNVGDPAAIVISSLGDAAFATVPMKVVTPGRAGPGPADCTPQPLPPSASDALLDKNVVPSVSIPPLFDLDGDGFLDLIGAIKSASVLRFDGDWCLYFGTGGPTFRAGRWSVPRITLAIGEAGFNEETTDRTGERHIRRTTGAALQDMNGDGLPDLIAQTSDRILKAYLNTGSGFRFEPLILGVSSPVEIVQTDYAYAGDSGPVTDGDRGYRLRLIDMDADRLPDLVTTSAPADDIGGAGRVFVRFNAGDHFNSPVEVPSRWAEARRLLKFRGGEWQLVSDFVDVDGDGHEDLATWATNGTRLTFAARPGLPEAPDLLKSVENGRGSRVSFNYAVSTDQTAVRWNPLGRTSDLPQPTWVVRTVAVSAGFGTPDMVTRYTYADPRLLSAGAYRGLVERVQFVGMGRTQLDVRKGGESSRETIRRYAYGQDGAPDGRVVEEWLYGHEGSMPRLHRYTVNEWEWKPLFGGRTYAATLGSTSSTTCLANASDVECAAQAENVSRSQETWVARGCGSASQALYVRTSRLEGIGLTAGDHDRHTASDYEIVCGGIGHPEYRVLLARTRFYEARPGSAGSVFDQRGDTRVTYDEHGMPVQTDEYLDANTVATTKRSFDTSTGNLLRVTKPEQAAAGGSGKSTANVYDAHRLYVRKRVDELGHAVVMRHDVATGSLLERRGPNAIELRSGKTVFERETWAIDGLGRTIARAQSFDDRVNGYRLRTVARTRYFDAALPNRIRIEQLRDVGGSVWVTTDRTVDGLGRTLVETQLLGSGKNGVTTYEYDGNGNVRDISVPDPRRDDGTRVRYVYRYDDLDRLISLRRPDGSGIRITYAGLNRTVREIANDGSGSTRTQIFDELGRLIAVRDLYANAEPGVTRYRYDGRDKLIGVTDADGNLTRLERDWAERRTAITRGDRTWRYSYDRNGNLVSKRRPAPATADPAWHTVTSSFDDLDRVRTVTFTDIRPAPPYEKVLVTIRYFYDEGKNGIGRLHRVTLPFGQIRYGYEARGLISSEQRSFALTGVAEVSDTQRVRRSYNALGQLTQSVWDDGQRWRIGYDRRGLVERVDWYDPTGHWKHVARFDRSLAGQPRVRNTSFDQRRRYEYDALGRVIRDRVVAGDAGGSPLATRTYSFSDSGDLRSVGGATAGVSAASTYTYDDQHRLIGASGPGGYGGSFTYAPSGNVRTAQVDWDDSTQSRNVRYQYGARDAQAVQHLVDQTNGDVYASFQYDLGGNMVERETPSGTTSLTWDGLDRLRVAQSPSGQEVYFYDHTGTRVLAANGDGVRFWFGESETHYTLDGSQARRYLHLSVTNATYARVENRTKVELQYSDALQNLILTANERGKVGASFLYGAYGEVVNARNARVHRRQFNGKEHDALTSLRYYGYRYYDPLALRWNSGDPLYRFAPEFGASTPQTLNLYAFSLDNPVRYYDADGRQACEEETSCVLFAEDECADVCVEQHEEEPATCEAEAEEVCYPEETAASSGTTPEATESTFEPEFESHTHKELGSTVFVAASTSHDPAKGAVERLTGLEYSKSLTVGPEGELGNDVASIGAKVEVGGHVAIGAGIEGANIKATVGGGAGVGGCVEACLPTVLLSKSLCVGACGHLGIYAEAHAKAGTGGVSAGAGVGPVQAGVVTRTKDSPSVLRNVHEMVLPGIHDIYQPPGWVP
jgi:RHS repeat-associated protein